MIPTYKAGHLEKKLSKLPSLTLFPRLDVMTPALVVVVRSIKNVVVQISSM